MGTVRCVFPTRQQALEKYRQQLSQRQLFVESFEPERAGTLLELCLEITESRQKIVLPAEVLKVLGKSEAIERGLGQRAGMLLGLQLVEAHLEPLRQFFMAEAAPQAGQSFEAGQGQAANRHVSSVARSAQGSAGGSPSRVQSFGFKQPLFMQVRLDSPELALSDSLHFLERAREVSLFELFGLSSRADKEELRAVYYRIVKILHPDKYPENYDIELIRSLEAAYQLYNEAYAILQHPEERNLYLEISRMECKLQGLGLTAYKNWLARYRQQNASKIKLAAELLDSAHRDQAAGKAGEAAQKIQLAIQYDPLNMAARAALRMNSV